MISIRRMSLGSGYRYLMESVAVGDGAAHRSSMVDYYAQSGTPAGRFLGAGLAGLGDGQGIPVGSTVSEEDLFQMLGMCADPVTGKALGRAPNRAVASLQRRIAERIRAIPAGISDEERAELIGRIEVEEQARSGGVRPPVAGFDLTFNPSKAVSAAWALADPDTKAVIYDCHLRAIEIVLEYAEREVFRSRSGTDGVVEEDIVGVVAAAFTHWDSRSGDPQLHDHVVVLNRAQSVSDGKWRTLDSRGLFKAVVALSEMHQGVLSDLLTEQLGWGWDGRPRPHSDRLAWEVTGVPEALMAEFSRRSSAIEARKDALIGEFVKLRGRQPTATEVIRLRQRATLETRPDKVHRSLAEMTAEWGIRSIPYLDGEPESWVASLADRNDLPVLRSDDIEDEILDDVARVALDKVASNRATFSRWNVAAEVHRQLHGVRFVRWHFQDGLGLSREVPDGLPSANPPDRYSFDPSNPAPGLGGPSLDMVRAGRRNQRRREVRPDVVTYTSVPLPADLTVAGPVNAEVWVRCSIECHDLFVRLCDVHPSGRSYNVCDGIIRLDSSNTDLQPDGTNRVRVALWPAATTFRRGHRVRVQVSSAAHPLYARNPGSGEPLGSASTLRSGEHEIFHDADHPSAIELPVTQV